MAVMSSASVVEELNTLTIIAHAELTSYLCQIQLIDANEL